MIPDSASSRKASFSRSSWPTPPMLVASLLASSSSSLAPFLPFLPFFPAAAPPLFFSLCSVILASSSAKRLRFKPDCSASKYTSTLNAKCPAMKTTHPICGVPTLGLSAGSASTMSPATSPASLPAGAGSSPSQIGAISPTISALQLARPRTPQSMRRNTCSHNLSGHCCNAPLAFGAMESSKERSMAHCAVLNHCAGTSPQAKHLTTTKMACSQSSHMWLQVSSLI
mmetsp:Transcript_93627/g.261963  ORF Transcript_93627/g.261963 Transcript_93627/m.261963 type:complete len:227 (+) Transcript_93627:544-1224(+)